MPSVIRSGEEGSVAGVLAVLDAPAVSGMDVIECGGGEEGSGVWCWYTLLMGGLQGCWLLKLDYWHHWSVRSQQAVIMQFNSPRAVHLDAVLVVARVITLISNMSHLVE